MHIIITNLLSYFIFRGLVSIYWQFESAPPLLYIPALKISSYTFNYAKLFICNTPCVLNVCTFHSSILIEMKLVNNNLHFHVLHLLQILLAKDVMRIR